MARSNIPEAPLRSLLRLLRQPQPLLTLTLSLQMLLPLLLLLPQGAHGAAAPRAPEVSCASFARDSGRCAPQPDGSVLMSVDSSRRVGYMSSRRYYKYGVFSASFKFQPGYSGGVIFAFYLIDGQTASNKDPNHSEIDTEFYGAEDGKSIMIALNVFCRGKQNLAQYRFPVDPSLAFHSFTMIWSPRSIAWLLDGRVLRVLQRSSVSDPALVSKDPASPDAVTRDVWPLKPMSVRFSVWDTSGWSRLKANYSQGPIYMYVKNPSVQGCAGWSFDSVDSKCVKVSERGGSNLPWTWQPDNKQLRLARNQGLLIQAWNWGNA